MSDVYEFVVRDTTIPLAPGETGGALTGQATVDVTSRLDRHENAMFRVVPAEGADETWFSLEPENQFLQIDNTATVTVNVNIPGGTPAGTYRFSVGAYAESEQQRDYTVSQDLTIDVPETDPGPKFPIPWWILAIAAAALVIIIGLIIWLFTRSDDPEPEAITVESYVGMTTGDAEAAFAGTVTIFADGSESAGDDCVLLQAPVAGTAADSVALLTTPCPAKAPEPKRPESLSNLCEASFAFCNQVDQYFPDPPNNEEWQEATLVMANLFLEEFSVPGTDMPSLIGLPLLDAREALREAGLTFNVSGEDDGGGSEPCFDDDNGRRGQPVLFQHPYPGSLVATNVETSLVLTSCPPDANRPEQVQIESFIDLNTYGNLEVAVPDYATALENDPNLGAEYLSSDALKLDHANMTELFRYQFAVSRVPDTVGMNINQATNLMMQVGLVVQLEVLGIIQEGGFCPQELVASQSREAGIRVADLPADSEVVLAYNVFLRPCRGFDDFFLEPQVVDQLDLQFDPGRP